MKEVIGFLYIALPIAAIALMCYFIYKKIKNSDSGTVDIEMGIPEKVSMGNCCSASKSASAAYCFGGWGKDLSGPLWDDEKCDKAIEYLTKCDEKYSHHEIAC